MVYVRNENYVLRKVHDTFFFIDITDNYKDDTCKLIETNEIGEFIWNALSKENTIESIAKKLKIKIIEDISFEIILEDVRSYISVLENKNIVIGEKLS